MDFDSIGGQTRQSSSLVLVEPDAVFAGRCCTMYLEMCGSDGDARCRVSAVRDPTAAYDMRFYVTRRHCSAAKVLLDQEERRRQYSISVLHETPEHLQLPVRNLKVVLEDLGCPTSHNTVSGCHTFVH